MRLGLASTAMNDCMLLEHQNFLTGTDFRIGNSAKNAFHSSTNNTVFDVKTSHWFAQ
jgi:hypothetical protein